jgi:hypothetical protein
MKDSALEIRTGTEQNFQKTPCSDSHGDIAHPVTEQFKFPTEGLEAASDECCGVIRNRFDWLGRKRIVIGIYVVPVNSSTGVEPGGRVETSDRSDCAAPLLSLGPDKWINRSFSLGSGAHHYIQ